MLLAHRSSIHFGDFPTWAELKKHEKHAGKSQVTAARFWYPFRRYLGLISIIAFVAMFLLPFFFASSDDGYLFYGNLLSFCSCTLVIISYYHVVPWRRHPSSLILQISVTSLMISIMLICTTHPIGNLTNFNNYGISFDDDHAKNSYSRSFGCQLMSFFMQIALIAREMWVCSLSYDLVTSITNPFASYQKNLRKYHFVIWSVAIISASVLLIQSTCQGRFLSDGTCWIRINASQSLCFWGYFLGWVAVFYLFSIITMFYAYFRISKGLKSSYATRYACVAATFRVVFFYLLYCIVFYSLIMILYFHGSQSSSHLQTNNLERITCYFIASRGFFDGLVWFFSHGFSVQSNNNINSASSNNNNSNSRSSINTRRDTDVSSSIYNIITGKLHLPKAYIYNLIGGSANVAVNTNMEGDQIDNSLLIPNDGHQDDDDVSVMNSSRITIDGSQPATTTSSNSNSTSMNHHRTTATTVVRDMNQITDIDLTPQLNFALRAELLYLVTQGVKECVVRMNQRDVTVLMSHNNNNNGGGKVPTESSSTMNEYNRRETSQSFGLDSPINRTNYRNGADIIDNDDDAIEDQAHTECDSTKNIYSNRSLLSSSSYNVHNTGINTTNHSNTNTKNPIMQNQHTTINTNTTKSYSSNPATSFSLLATGNSIQYAMKSVLCGILGIQIPGEYGVDPISYSGHSYNAIASNITMNNSTTTSPSRDINQQQPTSSSLSQIVHPATILKQSQTIQSTTTTTTTMNNVAIESNSFISTQHRPLKSVHIPTHHPYTNNILDNNIDTESNSNSYESSSELNDPLLLQKQQHPCQSSSLPYVYAPAEVIFYLNSKHQFRDFRPASFRRLRQMSGLSDEKYLELIAQPTKERLSEGASGAFFFFCGEGELIVKTVAKHEAHCLLKILDEYIGYLHYRTDSLLVRFLGLHSINMYGNEFTFVVMKNIFPCHIRMNDRYDIKGSWINRNAQRKIPGKRATCKYCNEYYIEGSNSKCSEVIGCHEAVVTLKDNDMITKIKINPQDAYALIDVLNSDSDALCNMGLMDYSLLVGVQTIQYELDVTLNTTQYNTNINNNNNNYNNNNNNNYNNSQYESSSSIYQTPIRLLNRDKVSLSSHSIDSGGYPARAVIAPSMYYMGVIDILQTWSWGKQLEYICKVYILRQPPEGISCIPPSEYKIRYQKKISQIIEHSIFVREVTGSWRGKRHVSDPHFLTNVNSDSLQRLYTQQLSIPPTP